MTISHQGSSLIIFATWESKPDLFTAICMRLNVNTHVGELKNPGSQSKNNM